MALGARVALRRPSRNRLKIGVRREGTVSNGLLEARRLNRTDGGDPLSICLGARRGGYIAALLCETSDTFLKVHHYLLKVQKNGTAIVTLTKKKS